VLDEREQALLRRAAFDATISRAAEDKVGMLGEALTQVIALTAGDNLRKVIDALLERTEYVDYWSMKWCDLLRVKSEFPINLWPNAVQAYQRWICEALRTNMPYDRMAREMLTASGSNFRVPQVNFHRAVQGRGPQPLSAAVALTFMGSCIEK